MHFSTCQERSNAIWSDIMNSITQTKWVRRRRLCFCLCDLRYSQPVDINHTATCCQLCVVTCASAVNTRLFFFLAPVATPKEKCFPGKKGVPATHQQAASRFMSENSSGVKLKHLHCLICSSKVPILFFPLYPFPFNRVKKPGHLRQVAPLISQCRYPPSMDE